MPETPVLRLDQINTLDEREFDPAIILLKNI
jgi:hypothetical protein